MTDSAIAKALAAFHAELPDVSKGSTNPHFGSKYADLADIVKVVLPALARQGLAWIAAPRITEDGFVLAYELRHESGERIKGTWPLPDPTKATPQVLGSALTYAKRYTLSAVTGIAPDEDDDGNHASSDSAARAVANRRAPRAKPADAAERVSRAAAAIMATTTHAELAKVWDDIARSGLDGRTELIDAKAAKVKALGPAEAPQVDPWGLEPPAEVQR